MITDARYAISLFALATAFAQGSAFAHGSASAAQAAKPPSSEKYLLHGVDIAPAIRYYNEQIVELKTPATVYNYSPSGNDPLWGSDPGPENSQAFAHAQNLTRSFWANYGSVQGAGNMYGYGLYAAVDPVSTFSYGSFIGQFLLLELRLPVGFRMLDLGNASLDLTNDSEHANDTASEKAKRETLKEEVRQIQTKFACASGLNPNYFFANGAAGHDPKCLDFAKVLFSQALKIDGFAYNYGKTYFRTCSYSEMGSRAFVFTRPDWMTPDSVRFYNTKSVKDREDRARIQTLFFESRDTIFGNPSDAVLAQLTVYLKSHPQSNIRGSSTKCDGHTCEISVKFCEKKEDKPETCESVNLGTLPRAGGDVITEEEAKSTPPTGLLWPDLEGEKKSATIRTWLKENMYACNGEKPYTKPNAESAASEKGASK